MASAEPRRGSTYLAVGNAHGVRYHNISKPRRGDLFILVYPMFHCVPECNPVREPNDMASAEPRRGSIFLAVGNAHGVRCHNITKPRRGDLFILVYPMFHCVPECNPVREPNDMASAEPRRGSIFLAVGNAHGVRYHNISKPRRGDLFILVYPMFHCVPECNPVREPNDMASAEPRRGSIF